MSLLRCNKCLLSVCCTALSWNGWWRFIRFDTSLCFRNCRWQVRTHFPSTYFYSSFNTYTVHSSSSIRGILGSVLTLSGNAGMVFGFVIGNYLEYFTQLKIQFLFPIAYLVAFNYFPDTPDYLLLRQKRIVSASMHWIVRSIIFVHLVRF